MSLKSKRMQRESIVAGIFCGSVVARMNITWAGGSSSVFNIALKADGVSMWTSSMMYTLCVQETGGYCTFSLRSLISSTPLFDAASISVMSRFEGSASARHVGQTPHGDPSCGFSQFTARAKIFASVVFPVPRGPVKRYACPTLFSFIWFFKMRTMCSCLTTSSKVCGRKVL